MATIGNAKYANDYFLINKLNDIFGVEEYRIIKDYPNYKISNKGNIKNIKTNKTLKTRTNDGYYIVNLYINKKMKTVKVHRLIAQTFIPNTENKQLVDHIDNNKINNLINNLRWSTNNENQHNVGLSKANKSGVKGVYFNTKTQKWDARIMIDGKIVYIGQFRTLREATESRKLKASELFKDFTHSSETIVSK